MEDTSFVLPATPKQIAYARSLALRNQTLLPWDVQQDRRSLSSWIEAQSQLRPIASLDSLPSSDRSGCDANSRSACRASFKVSPNATCDLAAETTARAIHCRWSAFSKSPPELRQTCETGPRPAAGVRR